MNYFYRRPQSFHIKIFLRNICWYKLCIDAKRPVGYRKGMKLRACGITIIIVENNIQNMKQYVIQVSILYSTTIICIFEANRRDRLILTGHYAL